MSKSFDLDTKDAFSEGLTEMDLSREVLQFPLNSKEVGAGKSAVYPRFSPRKWSQMWVPRLFEL